MPDEAVLTGTATMLDIALDYLHRGWPVFPVCTPVPGKEGWCEQHREHAAENERRAKSGRMQLAKPGKHPLVSWGEFQHRLPTEDEVIAWWTRFPTANIGMVTGTLSGLVVLDADGLEAYTGVLSRGSVEPTPVAATGSPNHYHWYLRHPGRPVKNFAGDRGTIGLDFRGDGGYVVLPPSLHQSGHLYAWLQNTEHIPPRVVPLWLLHMLSDGSSPQPRDGVDGESQRGPIDIEGVLRGVPEGQRDDTLYRTACRLRSDNVPIEYAELLIRTAAANCSPPFPASGAVDKVREAYRRYPPSIVLGGGSNGTAASNEAGQREDYPIWTLGEMLGSTPVRDDQLVEGILWANRITWAYAAPGVGKTLFVLAMALHIAADRVFLGRPITAGPVLLIEEDSPFSVLSEYTDNLADIYDIAPEPLPFYVNREQGLRITDEAGLNRAKSAVEKCPQAPLLIMIDACERLVPSDRYTSRELDYLLRFLRWVIGRGATAVVIDHTKRPQTGNAAKAGAPVDPMELLSGSRAKQAISDVMMYFSGNFDANGVRITFPKFRGETPSPMDLTYSNDSGFTIKDHPTRKVTPTEKKILAFMNNSPIDWYALETILTEGDVPDRSGRRALDALVKRRSLLKQGAKKGGTEYRNNPALSGGFEL